MASVKIIISVTNDLSTDQRVDKVGDDSTLADGDIGTAGQARCHAETVGYFA